MKVAMVCPLSPSGVAGGAERLWHGVVDAINELTEHDATFVGIRSPEATLTEVVRSYATFDALDVSRFDLVITGKYPAWMITHPRHVVHMCHPLRGLYDTYGSALPTRATPSSFGARELVATVRRSRPGTAGERMTILSTALALVDDLPADHPDLAHPGPLGHELVHWLDADALHTTRIARHLAISPTVARRRGYFPADAHVGVAIPPSSLAGLHTGPFNSIFTASRLDGPKRIALIIDAMAHVPSDCSLRIAGTGPLEHQLRSRAALDDRITFLGMIDDERLVAEYADALVVPFVPVDEDLGLIALEAQTSGKPVITCTDSGGTTDLVTDGVDGFVTAPDPRAVGAAITSCVVDAEMARSLGERGLRRAAEITWAGLVGELLEPCGARPSAAPRGLVLALSTYAVEPAHHGGQIRMSHLYRALAKHFDIHYIALTERASATEGAVSPGLFQTVIEPSPRSRELEAHLAAHVRSPLGDVLSTLVAKDSVDLAEEVALVATHASAIVLTHPYLFPFVKDLDPHVPIVYDSQNAEWSLKDSIYPASAVGRALADTVADVEAATVRRASLITTVSAEDSARLRSLAPTMAEYVVVENGVDIGAIEFVTGEERRSRRAAYLSSLHARWDGLGAADVAVFVGSGHPPNVDAAKSVLELAAQLPDVLFVLLGSHVRALAGVPTGANVIARGVVDHGEIKVILAMCTVALNPMRSGSGTNIKMLDYFAAGAPTIASAIGARGLGITNGEHLLLAEPDEMLEAVRCVRADPEAADRRAARAREAALPYDWATLGATFARAIRRAVDANPIGREAGER